MFSYYGSTIFKREDALKLKDTEEVIIPEGIEEIEERAFLECLKLKKIVLPKTLKLIGESTFSFCLYLKEIIIPEGIETIETETFSACHNLKKITLPNSLKKIGASAFRYCNSLEEIVIPEGVEEIESGAFFSCSSLKKVVLPSTLKKIETRVFVGCESLRELKIPEGVGIIGLYAFDNCTKVNLPNTLVTVGEYNYNKSVIELIIPEGVEHLEKGAFRNFEKLEKIKFPSSLKIISEYAFNHCISLEEIEIPEGVEDIKGNTFNSCEKLKKITLPNSLKNIYRSPFYGCQSLEEIVIPEGVKSLGESCFSECKNLKKVNLPNSLKKIGARTFKYCNSLEEITIPEGVEKIEEDAFGGCKKLKKITLPNSLKEIEWSAFSFCISLEEITIPEGVEKISSETFKSCSKLKKIAFPNSLKSICNHAFYGCEALKEIIIPEGVKYIGHRVFATCKSLEEITISEGVEEIEYCAFEECENLRKIKLPYSLTEAKNIFFKNDKLEEIEMYANKKLDIISIFYDSDKLSRLVNTKLNIRYKSETELIEFIKANIRFFKVYRNINYSKNKIINFIGPQVGNLEKKINRLLTTSIIEMFTIKQPIFRLINEYDYLKEQAEVELEKEKRNNNNKYFHDQEVNDLITKIQELTTFLPDEYKEQIDNKINEMVSEYYEKCEQFIPKYGELNTIELNFQNIETIKLDLISKLNLLNFNLYNIKKYNELLSNTKLYEKMINDSSLESIIINNYSKTYDISKPIDISKIESMEDIDECIKLIYIISDIYKEEEKNNIRQQLKQIIENEITNIYNKIQKELEGNPFNDEIVKEKDELTLKIIQMTKDLVETHNNKGMYIKLLKDIQTTEVEYKSSEEIKDIIKSLKYIITYVEKEEDKKFNDKLSTIIDKYKNIINNIIDDNRDEETDYDEIETNLKNELLLLVIEVNEEIYKYRYIEIPLKMKKDLLERKKSIINELLLLKQILIHNQAVDIEQRDILYISDVITIYKQVLSSSTRNISIKKYNFLICINQYLLLLEKDSNPREYVQLELEIKKMVTHMENELKLLLYENNINSSKKVI